MALSLEFLYHKIMELEEQVWQLKKEKQQTLAAAEEQMLKKQYQYYEPTSVKFGIGKNAAKPWYPEGAAIEPALTYVASEGAKAPESLEEMYKAELTE